MAMTVELPIEQTSRVVPRTQSARLSRYARPALGLLLPVGVAVLWELIVWLGYSNGRLVPPPSRVFVTIVELARSGELSRHIIATLTRVALGFGLGVIAGTILTYTACITAFVTQTLIGGARLIYMPLHIYQQAIGANNWPFAAAISVVFMIAVLIIVGILGGLGRRSETYARA